MVKINVGEYQIISVECILKLLDDYKIGKKPLAKLLGWGETTIIRYIEGDIPTKEYSEKLNLLIDNPRYYYEILLRNQSNITGVAFKKSKYAVLKELMKSRINIVSQYIVNIREAQICLIEIQNLLYYIQGFTLAFYEMSMFEEECMITADQIPYPKLYEEMKGQFTLVLEIDENILTMQEKNMINEVVEAFAWYGTKTLKNMISYEKSILKISRDKDNNKIVTKETLKNYFKEVRGQYGINLVSDIKKYPDKRFLDLN